jgi:DNA-binding MarR family transcriptional regulator
MVQRQQRPRQTEKIDISDLASALADITPRLLRRMNADVPLPEEGVGQGPSSTIDEGLRVVSELRATPGQLSLLRVLVEHERCMMQEIAEHLAVTPSTATAMVKRLVASGYVERSRDDTDWRTVWIRATEQGREAFALYNAVQLAALKRRLEQLSEEEHANLLAALPALKHLVEVYA